MRSPAWQQAGLRSQSNVCWINERGENGPFRGFGDFLSRVPLPPTEIDALIRSGVFDSIAGGLNRPQLLRQHALVQAGGSANNRHEPRLFGEPALPPAPRVRDYTVEQKFSAEAETLGFVVSVHPLCLFESQFRNFPVVRAEQLRGYMGRTVKLAGWQVTRKRLRTKDGEPMAFVTFEDTTGLYETVIFPREYDRLAPVVSASGPFLVTGEVTEELGAITLTLKDLRLLSNSGNYAPRVRERSIWAEGISEVAA